MIVNVYWSSCKVPVIIVSFKETRIFSKTVFQKKTSVSIFLKILSMAADGRMDRQTGTHDEGNSPISQFWESA